MRKLSRDLPFWVALVALGILYAGTLDAHGMFMWDEAEYACLARAIVRGEPYTDALRPPMLPLSGSVALLLSARDADADLKMAVLLFALMGLWVVYAFMVRQVDRPTGLAAMGLLGLAPAYWDHATWFLAEIPLIVFFTGALFLFYRGLYGGPPACLYGCWVCVALALLTRYTALLFGPLCLLFTAFAALGGGRAALRSRHFWLSPLAGVAVMAPWLIRAQLVHGDALVGFKIASGQLQRYLPGVSMPWDFYLLGLPELIGWPGLVLFAIGAVWAAVARDRFALHLLVVVAFFFVWFGAYRYKELRLITAVLPFMACVAAVGMTRAVGGRWPEMASLASIACVLLLPVATWDLIRVRPAIVGRVALGYPSFLDAARYVREVTPADAVVMGAPTPQLSWYLDRRVVPLPGQEADLRAALEGVDRVVVVNWERGQPAYVGDVLRRSRLTPGTAGVTVFSDASFANVVIPADALSERLR
ncbi:MAG: glycosyltransferase family 39 protein [Candidatus Eremiobacterota bacterium]